MAKEAPAFMTYGKPPPPPPPSKFKIAGWTQEKDDALMYVMIALALISVALKWYARAGGMNQGIPTVDRRFDKFYNLPMGEPR